MRKWRIGFAALAQPILFLSVLATPESWAYLWEYRLSRGIVFNSLPLFCLVVNLFQAWSLARSAVDRTFRRFVEPIGMLALLFLAIGCLVHSVQVKDILIYTAPPNSPIGPLEILLILLSASTLLLFVQGYRFLPTGNLKPIWIMGRKISVAAALCQPGVWIVFYWTMPTF